MNNNCIIKLLILFIIFTFIGIWVAEKGLNGVMGLDIRPKSFDFVVLNDNIYDFTVLGNSIKFHRYYKIGDIAADKGHITLNINGKTLELNYIIPIEVVLKDTLNLDKKPTNMYN